MRSPAVFSAALAALLLASTGSHLVAQSSRSPIRKLVDVDAVGTYGIAEPSSGRFLVYATPQGIFVLDPRTGKRTATIDRATAAVAQSYFTSSFSISASGRRLVFLASGESNANRYVWSVDLDTVSGKPASLPHRVSIMPAEGARISDDGRWIALVTTDATPFTQGTRKLLVMPSDGGNERMLDSAPRIQSPHWTPDGKTIYYIRGRGKGPALARIAAVGGKPDSLAPAVGLVGVSPDGQRVAYYLSSGGNRTPLRVADLQGREIGTFTVGSSDIFLAWSRHEPATMFGRRSEQTTSFKVVSLDNGKVSSYSLVDRFATSPRFSPNGRQLAAVSYIDDRAQVVVFDVASKQRRVLQTIVEPDGGIMQWSPDGSRIALLALDSSLTRHDLYVIDVATSHAARLADLGPARRSNSVLFRWRSDGASIDYITGAAPNGGNTSLERVKVSGNHTFIRKLASVPHGQSTDGGYRLLNDSLVAIGRDYPKTPGDSSYLAIVDVSTGANRTFINRFAYWEMGDNMSVLSPDGKWLAFGSGGQKENQTRPQWAITSLDGKTVRLLGEPMSCDAFPHQWLPDSRALIAFGVQSCDDYRPEAYVVPIDGGPARHLSLPESSGATVTPDGRSILVAAVDGSSTSLIAIDVTKALAGKSQQAGKLGTSGKN